MDKKNKDFIDDGLDNVSIINTIKEIRNIIENDNSYNIEKLKKEYNFFANRYPMLFDISVRKDEAFNWDYLNYFLNMRTKIVNNELTVEKASVIVGDEWYKKHVNITEEKSKKSRKT